MNRSERRRGSRAARWGGAAFVTIVVLGAGLAIAAYVFLRASLPKLDGSIVATELDAPVTITRDAAGVPTLRAGSQADLAYAMGFVHAQDRYFQMDLLRRAGGGELAGLLGPRLLPLDRERRLHRFGARARAAVAALSTDDRLLLDRYVSGVNAGLASLGARPFEYGVLRTTPRPWRPEDTLLVICAFYFDLQDDQLHRVYSRGWLRDHQTTPEQLAFSAADLVGLRRAARCAGDRRSAGSHPGHRAAVVRQTGRQPGRDGRRAARLPTPSSAATTGRSPARAARPARRSSRSTCTWPCGCRTSGITLFSRSPLRRAARRLRRGSRASCRLASRASSPAATDTSPGASPTATAATSNSSS